MISFPRYSFCAVVIFITSCAVLKNDVQVKAAHVPEHRMIKEEVVEEVPLPMINDTDVILSVNVTAENATDVPEVDENNNDEDNTIDDAENSTASLEQPISNATLTTYSPSSSPSIQNEITESPTKASANEPTNSPSKHLVTVSPTATSTNPIDVSLNIQSINIVILTDVHSWVQGHGRHEPKFNADYGHILSFYQRLQELVKHLDSSPDLYLVNNGDFLHGTILGDDPPEHLVGILERMPFDAVTLGEHEVFNSKSIEKMEEAGGLFDEWGERLVTSNVRQSSGGEQKSVGNNYLMLQGNKGTVLVLGFLYNLNENESAEGITVADVQEVIEEGWFTSLFASCKHQPQFDAVVVLSHMDVKDELVTLLLSKFRKLCGQNMVVQFITGHTHNRSFVELDSHSSSIEAGRFLDTVGFVSFEPKEGSFDHNFIPANQKYLAQSLDMSVDEYPTNDGKELSEYIARTFDHVGAGHILGCASKRFNETELLEMHLNEVMPKSFLDHSHSSHNILLQYMGSFVGYDLFPGVVTMGDMYTVIPQDYEIQSVGSVMGSDVVQIMKQMSKDDRRIFDNATDLVGLSMASELGKSAEIENTIRYNLHVLTNDVPKIISIMNALGVKSSLKSAGKDTIRDMWIDYLQKNMPYDGNGCKCIDDANGCSSSGDDVNKTPPTSHHTSPPPQPTQPTSNPGSTVTGTTGGEHSNTSGSKGASLGKSHSNSIKEPTPKSSSSSIWMLAVIFVAIIAVVVRFGRRPATPEFGNDLEMQISPPPGYGDVSGGAGGYASPHLGRYV